MRFNQHEIASRLSYLFWASMPDDKLFAAADGGKLGSADQIAAEARRLLADPKARDAPDRLPPALAEHGRPGRHAQGPVAHRLLAGDGPGDAEGDARVRRQRVPGPQGRRQAGDPAHLDQRRFVDATLAKIYGIKERDQRRSSRRSTFDAAQRAGLFTQATFLTAKADALDSHPIKRGDAVLSKLLCMHLEVPANIMVPPLPEPKPGQTTRERVSVHSEAACATCHKLIDPLGFAFENYDAIGRYRTHRGGQAGRRQRAPSRSAPATVTFKNAVELMPQLAKSQEVRDCMVTQWWRYALRRQELATEEPSLKLVREAFKLSGYDLRELLVAFTRTRTFSHRMPSPDEVLQ